MTQRAFDSGPRRLALLVLAAAFPFLNACGANAPPTPTAVAATPGTDLDADGLMAEVEAAGWTIHIDRTGFGISSSYRPELLEERHVTSDPSLKDTDGDGVDDHTEWLIRTDPRDPDTDGDGLTDFEEWFRYFSSPVSVDSDSDATGPNNDQPPNASLFDGQELLGTSKGRTSPTLDDTDGDGKTDAEELDHPTRSPLIADFPKIKLEILGEPLIQLDIEYADGTTFDEGIQIDDTVSTEISRDATSSRTQETHQNHSLEIMTGAAATGGVTTGVTKKVEVTAATDWGSSDARTTEFSDGFTKAASRTASRFSSESNAHEETVSTGSVSIRVRVRNVSEAIAFEVTQIGVAARLWTTPKDPREAPSFRQLAVLTLPPAFSGGLTLAPGAATNELTFTAEAVNAQVIKEFLKNPVALTFEPIYFDLNNADGLNFAFLTENTYTQTAMIEIDRGEGEPEVVRVATNVDREAPGPDGSGGGAFVGIPLARALGDILGRSFATEPRDVTVAASTVPVSTLVSLEGKTETGGTPAPVFVGTARVTQGSAEIEIVDGPTPNPNATSNRFEDGWETAWIGRTFVMTGDDQAYVPVALEDAGNLAADPDQATLILDRVYAGTTRQGQYTLDDLFQADPHNNPVLSSSDTADQFGGAPRGRWLVLATDGVQVEPLRDFEDIVLRGGDQVRLVFWEDRDGDGISGKTEEYNGTSDDCLDCDGDRLSDSVEVIRGWIAGALGVLPIEQQRFFDVVDAVRANPGAVGSDIGMDDEEFERLEAKIVLNDPLRDYPRHVRSIATLADADEDDLTDLEECEQGTDPIQPDTDGDGLNDGVDPDPLVPAGILYVDATMAPGDAAANGPLRGLRWDTAFAYLQDALARAMERNAPTDYLLDANGDPVTDSSGDPVVNESNDISCIFVTGGTYKPDHRVTDGPWDNRSVSTPLNSFQLLPGVLIVGGFQGDEVSTDERPSPMPITTLSGALASGGDSQHVVTCGAPTTTSAAAALARVERDAGLMDMEIDSGTNRSGYTPSATHTGRALLNYGGAPTITRVVFKNGAAAYGGALRERDGRSSGGGDWPSALYVDCSFENNRVAWPGAARGYGGAVSAEFSDSIYRRCVFDQNLAADTNSRGGAVAVSGDGNHVVRFERCTFTRNVANNGGAVNVASGQALFRDCGFRLNNTDPLNARDATYNSFHHASWTTALTATTLSQYDLDSVFDYDGTEYDNTNLDNDEEPTMRFVDGQNITGGEALGNMEQYDAGGPAYDRPTPYDTLFRNEMIPSTGSPYARGSGGAVHCTGGHTVLVQCVLDRNFALAGGGVAFFVNAEVDIFHCTFAHNRAIDLAAAVYNPSSGGRGSMRSTVVEGQELNSSGSTVQDPVLDTPSTPSSPSNASNEYHLFDYEDQGAAGSSVRVSASGGWRKLKDFSTQAPVIPPEVWIVGTNYSFSSNIIRRAIHIEGTDYDAGDTLTGISVEDPGLDGLNLNTIDRVLGLESGSPCVNAGSEIDVDPFTPSVDDRLTEDFAGDPRKQGTIDIGAYELQP